MGSYPLGSNHLLTYAAVPITLIKFVLSYGLHNIFSVPFKNTVDHQAAEFQSTETSDTTRTTYEIPNIGGDYMTLHPSTRSWEISRKQIDIIKNIGKGAFSQVAKATVKNIYGNQGVITVAVKMLKGYGKLLAFFARIELLFDWID